MLGGSGCFVVFFCEQLSHSASIVTFGIGVDVQDGDFLVVIEVDRYLSAHRTTLNFLS